MTKMTTVPENYNGIRAGIVGLFKASRKTTSQSINTQ
jgi:hypothetical protein